MNRLLRFLWLPLLAAVLLDGFAQPASADPYGFFAGTFPRRETHEDKGDFRFTGELYANPNDRNPYWGYLAVSRELLMAPEVGHADFGLILVTPDGKAVREARWTEDHTIPYEQWNEMSLRNGKWYMRYDLERTRPGTKSIFFGGKIKKGKGSYTKLWLVFDLTVGHRKDARQADALQFMVYAFAPGRGDVDPMLLINAQEQMGAGGKRLIGPRVEEATTGTGQPTNPSPAPGTTPAPTEKPKDRYQPANQVGTSGRYPETASGPNQVTLSGFNGRVRLTGDSGRTVEYDLSGTQSVVLPEGAKSFWLDVLHGGTQWVRVKHNGRNQPFPTGTAQIAITRDR